MKQFRKALDVEYREPGYKSLIEINGADIVMTWWGKTVCLSLDTRQKTYLPQAEEHAMRADLEGFRRMSGRYPKISAGHTLDLARELPPGCLPLGHPMAVHRLADTAVNDLHDLCSKAHVMAMSVDNFCIAPDGALYCVHFSALPPPGLEGVGMPNLQPPWLFGKTGAKLASGALVQQLTIALYRLMQVFRASHGSDYEHEEHVLAAMFAPLGTLSVHLFDTGSGASESDHHWFQAGAIVLDALLGLSCPMPNVEAVGLGVDRVTALVTSAVNAMNKGLQPAGFGASAFDSLDELPLLTMQISAPVLLVDATDAPLPATIPPRFAILFSELVGKPPTRACMPFGSVIGHTLYSMRNFSNIFTRALLLHVVSNHRSVLVLDLLMQKQENGALYTWAYPAATKGEAWNLRPLTYMTAEALRATIESSKAEKVVIMVAVDIHQHVLLVNASQGNCIHFDPHGSIAWEDSAESLKAWFCSNLSQSWTQPIQFQSVRSWCNVLGPQTRLNRENPWHTLDGSLHAYLQGTCMLWSFWFVCLALCHGYELTPIQLLEKFYQDLDYRG